MAARFELSWNYSWRVSTPPANWDAVWVFIKYRRNGGNWAHASLSNTGHTAPAGSTIAVGLRNPSAAYNIATNPGAGVFIYKSADGFGTNSFAGVKLIWNYAQDGLVVGDSIDFQVHAIHMVYVPSGAFYAGDNNTSTSSFRQGSSDNDPWYVGGEGQIVTSNIAGSGTGTGGTLAEYYDATGYTIPAAFPKGHSAVYAMRHEITQEQWRSFFNTLPEGLARTNRDITATKGSDNLVSRNNLSWSDPGQATLPNQGFGATYCTVPMNYVNWADVAAWLDWAALRPMSELEFEKIARGPLAPVNGEYAWGSTTLTGMTGITLAGFETERPTNSGSYASINNSLGAIRVGGFASLNYVGASRLLSGGSYYGVLELSGNLRERVVTVADATGRLFTGVHGDGAVDANGNANATNWPGTSATGAGFRGGSWFEANTLARVSDRTNAATVETNRRTYNGGRGVRLAP